MKYLSHLVATAALASLNVSWVYAGPASHEHHQHHSHQRTFSAGEPGNPSKPARIIQVSMTEQDGKMLFVPSRIEVKRNEQVKFVLRNSGLLEHEFILATTADNLKHAEDMKANPDMAHEELNGKEVSPSNQSELVWKFTKAGEFEYACLIPGHREAGMTGIVVVK